MVVDHKHGSCYLPFEITFQYPEPVS